MKETTQIERYYSTWEKQGKIRSLCAKVEGARLWVEHEDVKTLCIKNITKLGTRNMKSETRWIAKREAFTWLLLKLKET